MIRQLYIRFFKGYMPRSLISESNYHHNYNPLIASHQPIVKFHTID